MSKQNIKLIAYITSFAIGTATQYLVRRSLKRKREISTWRQGDYIRTTLGLNGFLYAWTEDHLMLIDGHGRPLGHEYFPNGVMPMSVFISNSRLEWIKIKDSFPTYMGLHSIPFISNRVYLAELIRGVYSGQQTTTQNNISANRRLTIEEMQEELKKAVEEEDYKKAAFYHNLLQRTISPPKSED